ncbi:Glycosyl transferase family 2 [Friedmanniella luteola]|uniref:Glycosyl transferase family 2 n=1 Tax=Friedmanniella luteola TaxID=546871 RepID=A0A1H1YCJ8_9ACTN|nr:glycosyltransferase [Friedmanniella luteola]SDT19173.1 Glycosyl transferase family 2 [Friedmanniella luteola]
MPDRDTQPAPPFLPVPVGDLDLSRPGEAPTPNAAGQVLALVRVHGVPVGTLALLEPGEGGPVDLRALALERLGDAVAAHLAADGLAGAGPDALLDPTVVCAAAPVADDVRVSVVVCTLGEDPRLKQTVASVLAQTHPHLELVVVDNQPASGLVPALLQDVDDPRLRVVDQPRRGLSAARNAGVAAATGELVAFTDDDAFADPGWLARLVRPFAVDPAVVCTTGLVLPAELATPAQLWFEEFGAFDKGFVPTVWSTRPPPPAVAALGARGDGGVLFPYSAGVYGSGNNMAFRLDWLRGQALFDEALGAGSPTRGGEDLDAFLAVMFDGRALVYEPAAVVRHHARADMAALERQMYGYGSGMAAVVVKHALRPRRALEIGRRLPAGFRKLLAPGSEKNAGRSDQFPAELGRSELRGYAAGPLLYVRARRAARR